jgi:hypothetical protein
VASQTLDRTNTDNRVALRTALVVFGVGQAVASALVGAYGGAFITADRPGEPQLWQAAARH